VAVLPRPVVPSGPVRDLFDALHDLHHRAGWPSLREIAKDVGCSHTTVSMAFSDPRVPRWGLLELVVESLGGDIELFHRLWLAASDSDRSSPSVHQVTTPVRDKPKRRAPSLGPAYMLPRQLIADVAGFVGRRAELEWLRALLADTDRGSAAIVVAICGTAGVGKTTLALHWAHSVVARFPDGQLYVNLRGFGPSGSPVSAAQAVRGFLEGFGIPAERIPVTLDAQVALYRSILAGRRVLVVLDNARDAEHVRPLLPGSAGCLTVVTSRDDLTGLVAGESAFPLALDLMPDPDARELITRRIGLHRAAGEPDAVDRIVARCARLPLALAVVAARAATHPRLSLNAIADELDAKGGLGLFGTTDVATDTQAVLSWSYVQLSPEAGRLFRLLGLHPGPDITAAAAASLVGSGIQPVRRQLAELTRTNLVAEDAQGRYRSHDLLRAYAAELARQENSDTRFLALRRLIDHYLHTAHRGALLLNPNRHPIVLDPPHPQVTPEPLEEHTDALSWFSAERLVLSAIIRLSAASGYERNAWQLTWTMTTFLDRLGHWHDWIALQREAVEAACRLSDVEGQAFARRGLGLAYNRAGDHRLATTELRSAHELFARRGDRAGQAHTLHDLVWVYEAQGHLHEALDCANDALELWRIAAHKPGQAIALNSVGWLNAQLGNHAAANTSCRRAHDLFQELGDQVGVAVTLDSLGYAHHKAGDYDEAISSYCRAIEKFRELGDRYQEAESLANLGNTFHAIADNRNARRQWQGALCILEKLRHPHAVQVRNQIRATAL
jgi:tetratricopeptide (TPR) repeat protein